MPLVRDDEPLARLWARPETPASQLTTHADGRELAHVLRGRRSVREFAPAPLTLGPLTRALASAEAFDRQSFGLWPGPAPSTYLAALRVTDRDPGIYRITAAAGPTPARLASFLETDALAVAYCRAPALFLLCADIGAHTESPGEEGYRRLLVRVAGFGHALWLAARAAGLEGCVFGRSAREITAAVRRDGEPGVRHLFTVAVGRAA
ncbi:nitroreductase family protein [Actinospica durhamensis]|uniref:Nitroreductase family protein n=1 Tax=Actinospica durhamensis TaxID=1508375 RepID=A0A941EY24_9ACTN|nr:nitroreductase family protein [Actinospica durhamensis]MBR7836074.1 nitroreductase family protein [Actinospica durhamensis]